MISAEKRYIETHTHTHTYADVSLRAREDIIICSGKAIKIKGIISRYQLSSNKMPAQACLLLFLLLFFIFSTALSPLYHQLPDSISLFGVSALFPKGNQEQMWPRFLWGFPYTTQGLSINNNKWALDGDGGRTERDGDGDTMWHLYLCVRCGSPVSMQSSMGKMWKTRNSSCFLYAAGTRSFGLRFYFRPKRMQMCIFFSPDHPITHSPFSFNHPHPHPLSYRSEVWGTHINKRKMKLPALTINNNFLFFTRESSEIAMNYTST